jgi:hypothetical protein
MVGDEARQDDHVVRIDLRPNRFRIDTGEIRVQRRAHSVQLHFLRVERPGSEAGLA